MYIFIFEIIYNIIDIIHKHFKCINIFLKYMHACVHLYINNKYAQYQGHSHHFRSEGDRNVINVIYNCTMCVCVCVCVCVRVRVRKSVLFLLTLSVVSRRAAAMELYISLEETHDRE